MNPEGTVYNAQGRINRISVLCIDAYGVAVKNGFEGTVEEWLESLRGDPPSDEQIEKAVAAYFAKNPTAAGSITTKKMVQLFADKWNKTSEKHFTQVVSIEGITPKSQVNPNPTAEQLDIFYDKEFMLVFENEGGVVTAHLIGQKLENDYTIRVSVTEVFT